MLESGADHIEVVNESLQGRRAIDEQTFVSLEVLNDRLERTKKLGGRFAGVGLSPAAENLRKQAGRLAVGQG
jgi:hypothetical protein